MQALFNGQGTINNVEKIKLGLDFWKPLKPCFLSEIHPISTSGASWTFWQPTSACLYHRKQLTIQFSNIKWQNRNYFNKDFS